MNYDLELEKAILGIMIRKNEIIPNITKEIQENDFFDAFHRELFRTIIFLNIGGVVDIVSLNKETKGRNPGLIAILVDMEVSVKNWQYYTESVKTLSIVRGLIELACEIKTTTPKTVKKDISDFIERATKLSDISEIGRAHV